jgi:hypothetical protein
LAQATTNPSSEAVRKIQGRNQQRVKFMYDDGTMRSFGQTIRAPDMREKLIFAGTDREFIYEGARDEVPRNAPKKKRYHEKFVHGDHNHKIIGEDTRSLYDDPRL